MKKSGQCPALIHLETWLEVVQGALGPYKMMSDLTTTHMQACLKQPALQFNYLNTRPRLPKLPKLFPNWTTEKG
jgi:hypothetical protein